MLLITAPLLALAQQPGPPLTPQQPVTDVYFGRSVVDNYRWLEATKSPEVLAWFKAQGDYTARTLDQLLSRDSLISAFARYDR